MVVLAAMGVATLAGCGSKATAPSPGSPGGTQAPTTVAPTTSSGGGGGGGYGN